jgi:hypothetical protein
MQRAEKEGTHICIKVAKLGLVGINRKTEKTVRLSQRQIDRQINKKKENIERPLKSD